MSLVLQFRIPSSKKTLKVHCWPPLSQTISEWPPTLQPDAVPTRPKGAVRVQIHDERLTTLQFRRMGTRAINQPAPTRLIIIPTHCTGAIVFFGTPVDPCGHNRHLTPYLCLELVLPNISANGCPIVPRAQVHRSPLRSNRLRTAQFPSLGIHGLETRRQVDTQPPLWAFNLPVRRPPRGHPRPTSVGRVPRLG